MYHFVLQLTSNKWVIFVLAHCNIIIKLIVFKLSKFSLFITLINHKPNSTRWIVTYNGWSLIIVQNCTYQKNVIIQVRA